MSGRNNVTNLSEQYSTHGLCISAQRKIYVDIRGGSQWLVDSKIIFNFGHLGCQNSLPTQECQGTTYLLPTFRHQPMRSQLASQPANEEPALFVHIFFWEICPYILQWQRQWQRQRTDSKGNTTTLDISQHGQNFRIPKFLF